VSWAWWDWPLTWLTSHRPSVLWHCRLSHLTRKIVSEVTYIAYTGRLNPVSRNNAPTLASCSVNKRGFILIFFGKQHQHTFVNNMHIQLSLSLYFYLLYLLLNSCGGNEAFWRQFMFVQQETPHLSLQICVRQTVQLTRKPGRIWRLMQECLCKFYKTLDRDTSDLMQRIIDTWARIAQNAQAVGQWRKRLYVCVTAKRHHFEHLLN